MMVYTFSNLSVCNLRYKLCYPILISSIGISGSCVCLIVAFTPILLVRGLSLALLNSSSSKYNLEVYFYIEMVHKNYLILRMLSWMFQQKTLLHFKRRNYITISSNFQRVECLGVNLSIMFCKSVLDSWCFQRTPFHFCIFKVNIFFGLFILMNMNVCLCVCCLLCHFIMSWSQRRFPD